MRKYRNQKTSLDGYVFDSRKEAARYQELKLLERAGEITALSLQPVFPLVVNGQKIAVYRGDFLYLDCRTGKRVLEDVKSSITRQLPVYRLKKKLLLALHGIAISEV